MSAVSLSSPNAKAVLPNGAILAQQNSIQEKTNNEAIHVISTASLNAPEVSIGSLKEKAVVLLA